MYFRWSIWDDSICLNFFLNLSGIVLQLIVNGLNEFECSLEMITFDFFEIRVMLTKQGNEIRNQFLGLPERSLGKNKVFQIGIDLFLDQLLLAFGWLFLDEFRYTLYHFNLYHKIYLFNNDKQRD